jgi:hypothetical protein
MSMQMGVFEELNTFFEKTVHLSCQKQYCKTCGRPVLKSKLGETALGIQLQVFMPKTVKNSAKESLTPTMSKQMGCV